MTRITDETYMSRCVELARNGYGNTSPNPNVGAVLVHEDKIVGEGWHAEYGGAHAEVNCIEDALRNDFDRFSEATMYVTLEPCAHYGNTPPCAQLLVERKIKKVVIGQRDPFEKVNGKGISYLKEHGIEVEIMGDSKSTKELLNPFRVSVVHSRPYVILKFAQSRDGYIARKSERTKISHPNTDFLVHKWRTKIDAILIGTNTAVIDDPKLNERYFGHDGPLRCVIDRKGVIPVTHNLMSDGMSTVVFTRLKEQKNSDIEWVQLNEDNEEEGILKYLHQRGVNTLMIEGGRELFDSFLKRDLWDEAWIITSRNHLRDGLRAPIIEGSLKSKLDLGHDSIYQILRN